MSLTPHFVRGTIVLGLGATLTLDVWNLFLRRAFGIPSLNYSFLGRWLLHMPRGTFHHASIAAAEPKPYEGAVGRVAHYTIGVVLTGVFLVLAPSGWLDQPSPIPPLVFGIATVVFPFLIMQPAFGLGIAAARTPKPAQARVKSLLTHTVFGIGLFIGAVGMRYLLRD